MGRLFALRSFSVSKLLHVILPRTHFQIQLLQFINLVHQFVDSRLHYAFKRPLKFRGVGVVEGPESWIQVQVFSTHKTLKCGKISCSKTRNFSSNFWPSNSAVFGFSTKCICIPNSLFGTMSAVSSVSSSMGKAAECISFGEIH